VTLHPISQSGDAYQIFHCTQLGLYSDDTAEVLERFAALRDEGTGIWVDTLAFQRFLRRGPTLSVLRIAFPEVEFISHNDAPPEIQFYEFGGPAYPTDLRPDQSRFLAVTNDDGRTYGGEFR